MRKRTKAELALAVVMTIMLSSLTVYLNQPRPQERFSSAARLNSLSNAAQSERLSSSKVQQTVRENIEGELAKGSFETVVKTLKNLTYGYGGIIPAWREMLKGKNTSKMVA